MWSGQHYSLRAEYGSVRQHAEVERLSNAFAYRSVGSINRKYFIVG